MTSFRQIEANRRNALKSTGPATSEGKQNSRRNAVRHGLTAETVIVMLEDAEDYKAFEAAITADYDAESAVERELVLRLASLLWRLRRATAMETGLFTIEAEQQQQKISRTHHADALVYSLFRRTEPPEPARTFAAPVTGPHAAGPNLPDDPNADLARCFLGLADRPNYALDRLSRYEAVLWRQAAQIVFTLNALRPQRPRERRRSAFRSWP